MDIKIYRAGEVGLTANGVSFQHDENVLEPDHGDVAQLCECIKSAEL